MVMNEKFAIVYATDDNYVDCTLVSMKSVLLRVKGDIVVYVICNNVSESNKERLLIADEVKLIDYDGKRLSEYFGYGHLTNTMFVKFDLANLIDEDKCMYLDGDTIVNGDLSMLMSCNLEGYYAAVVKDFWCASGNRPISRYIDGEFGTDRIFNSGMMLLNLKKMRHDRISELLHHTKEMCGKEDVGDQPILNYVFGSDVFYLPIRYNVPLANIRYGRQGIYRDVSEYNKVYSTNYGNMEELVKDAAVYHFFGDNENSYTKPIVKNLVDEIDREFSCWNPKEIRRLQRIGKTFIFSNVCRFTNRSDFAVAVKRLNICLQDTIICMNTAPWLNNFIDDIPPCRIITMHRFNRNVGGWFGSIDIERVQKRTGRISEIFMLDNGGNLFTFDGFFKTHIATEGYPEGKMPTTGFFALMFAKQVGLPNIELVNFYGSGDHSTPHFTCHDWDIEERLMANENHVFLEPIAKQCQSQEQTNIDMDGFGYSRPMAKVIPVSATISPVVTTRKVLKVFPRISPGSGIRHI